MPGTAEIAPVAAKDYYDHVRSEIAPLLPADIKTVLEIGCGAGATMAWLRSVRAIDYAAGVEYVAAVGERARACFDDIEIGPVDAMPLDFAVRQFDLILALDVLEHLDWPWRTVQRLSDRLRPGGLFIASIPNVGNYQVALPLLLGGRWDYQEQGHLDRTHLRFFSRASARGLFEANGFQVERLEVSYLCPNLFDAFGWRSAAARWYSQKICRALPIPRHLIESQYLIAARKP